MFSKLILNGKHGKYELSLCISFETLKETFLTFLALFLGRYSLDTGD